MESGKGAFWQVFESPSPCRRRGRHLQLAADAEGQLIDDDSATELECGRPAHMSAIFQRKSMLVRIRLLDVRWTPTAVFLLSI
jgi:hypothetical protein